MKYAKEHVMVKVIRGHVLTELNATTHISDWFDGQSAHIQGRPLSKMYATNPYIAGYNATSGTTPPEIPLSQQVLAQKLADPYSRYGELTEIAFEVSVSGQLSIRSWSTGSHFSLTPDRVSIPGLSIA